MKRQFDGLMVTLTAVPGVAVDTSDGDSVTVYLLEGMFAAVIAVLIELSTVVLVALLEMAVRAPSRGTCEQVLNEVMGGTIRRS